LNRGILLNKIMLSEKIILLFVGAVIEQIVIAIFSFIKKFLYRTEKEKCYFKYPDSGREREMHEAIIKKHFLKVKSIDCGWYERLTKEGGFQGFKYPQCLMAEFPKGSTEAGKCKFYK